jgi:hypothetical protein
LRNQERTINELIVKKKSINEKTVQEKKTPIINSAESQKIVKSKVPPKPKPDPMDFKKKVMAIENKTTVKRAEGKAETQKGKGHSNSSVEPSKRFKNITLGFDQSELPSTTKIMEINLELDKVKSLYRSFDGSLMSSTIVNIDIEELVYAFAGFVENMVIASPYPKQPIEYHYPVHEQPAVEEQPTEAPPDTFDQSIEERVGDLLRESYLHPLYRHDAEHYT